MVTVLIDIITWDRDWFKCNMAGTRLNVSVEMTQSVKEEECVMRCFGLMYNTLVKMSLIF